MTELVQDADTNLKVLVQGFAMIIASEIGDKTFLIAAILAMRHPRGVVFAGAFGSLAVMSVLSAALGHVLPTLIPKSWTQFAAAVLFFVFGAKMLQEGREMKAGNAKIQEEMREAEEEIQEDDAEVEGTGGVDSKGRAIPLEVLEEGSRRHDDNVGNDDDSSETMPNGAGDQNSRRRPGVAFENSRVGGMTATERLAEVMRDYPRV